MAKKYQVIRAWSGVSVGQIVELDEVHPSLKSNVMQITSIPASTDVDVGMVERTKAEIAEMRKQAEAEIAQRVVEAQEQVAAEAKSIIDSANSEAERIKADALKQAGELTPSTPEATAKPTKTK